VTARPPDEQAPVVADGCAQPQSALPVPPFRPCHGTRGDRAARISPLTDPPATGADATDSIAVIIPAFNAGPFLDQALASVAGQTLSPNVVVVADDCSTDDTAERARRCRRSTDDTAERARRWARLLPLELVRLPTNVGPGPARRQAILNTDATLIATLDADDILLPDHLETMLDVYRRVGGLVTSLGLLWVTGEQLDFTRLQPPRRLPSPEKQLVGLLKENYVGNANLFSRALYERAGGYGDQALAQDWPLWIRMVRSGAVVTRPTHPTCLRRLHGGNRSADADRMVQFEIQILTEAALEARSARERQAARRSLSARWARKRYYNARAMVRSGHPWRARAL
jgi:hypothetical protein